MTRPYVLSSLRVMLFPLLLLPAAANASQVQGIIPLEGDFLKAEGLLQSLLPGNALWSFSVISLESGRRFDAGNSTHAALSCASLVKLLVTAALLEADAANPVSMDTIISTDGKLHGEELTGSVYVKGHGNALLSEGDLTSAADALVAQGIRVVSGDIVADDTYFAPGDYDPAWSGPAYSTPDALGIDLHTVSIDWNGDEAAVSPRNRYVHIDEAHSGRTIVQNDDLHYEIPRRAGRRRFALEDPAIFAVLSFRTMLEERGVTVRGKTRKGKTPEDATGLHVIKAKDLAEVIEETNNHSLNVMAENLFLALGAKVYGAPGTYEKSGRAFRAFMGRLGFSGESIHIKDGSGLSVDNRLRTADMAEFLHQASLQPWFQHLYRSLPRAGYDGTLKAMTYTSEDIRAKSGQTDSVFGLSGYFNDSSGKPAAFSLVVNVPGADLLHDLGSSFLPALTGGER